MQGLRSAALLLTGLGGLVLAQEAPAKVELKARHAEGESYAVRQVVDVHVHGKVEGEDFSASHHATKEYTETIEAAQDGEVQKAKRVYSTYRSTTERKKGAAAKPQSSTYQQPVVGRPVTLEQKPQGLEVSGEGAADLLPQDRTLLPVLDQILPGRAMAPGETWKIDPETLKRILTHANDADVKGATTTCRFEGMTKQDGKSLAKISVKILLDAKSKEGDASADLNGEELFDPKTGRALSLKLDGPVHMPIGNGTISIRITLSPHQENAGSSAAGKG